MSGGGRSDNDNLRRRDVLRGVWRRARPSAPPPAPVRPPGAVGAARFAALCDGCGECAAACPANAIVMTGPATALSAASPRIDAMMAPCVMCDGLVCSTSCPTGALEAVTADFMRIAAISVEPASCWAANGLDAGCDYCFSHCPLTGHAITWRRGGGPEIHSTACTGCGVCVQYCPATPKALTALTVAAL